MISLGQLQGKPNRCQCHEDLTVYIRCRSTEKVFACNIAVRGEPIDNRLDLFQIRFCHDHTIPPVTSNVFGSSAPTSRNSQRNWCDSTNCPATITDRWRVCFLFVYCNPVDHELQRMHTQDACTRTLLASPHRRCIGRLPHLRNMCCATHALPSNAQASRLKTMCGRYSITVDERKLADRFGARFVSGHFKLNHKVPRLLADQNAERQKPKQFTGDNLNRPGIVSGSKS